jgi:hypothetical protein
MQAVALAQLLILEVAEAVLEDTQVKADEDRSLPTELADMVMLQVPIQVAVAVAVVLLL